MKQTVRWRHLSAALVLCLFAPWLGAAEEPFVPQIGQAGKDVIWVPTPPEVVERMLQMAQVGPRDFVVDLGSGDGRTVIAAAKDFRARALGIEYNADMVAFARARAAEAGVSAQAQFVQGDIFASDFSQATVVTLYLLPNLNLRLRPTLLGMKPGTRVVSHQFSMGEWPPDETSTVEGRSIYLWIVPASVGGSWRLFYRAAGARVERRIVFAQTLQRLEGEVLVSERRRFGLRHPRLVADRLSFAFVDEQGVLREFSGRVKGDTIEGAVRASGKPSGRFRAERVQAG